MSIFWQEFLFFLVAMLGMLVSVSSGTLFFLTVHSERQLRTIWRAVGFIALAIAFFLFILERKYPGIELHALAVQAFGFIAIYLGVFAEPKLSQLAQVARGNQPAPSEHGATLKDKFAKKIHATPGPVFALVIALAIATWFFLNQFLAASLQLFAALFILATIPIQFRRWQRERDNPKASRQNLYPLIGYIALLFGALSLVFYRLPNLDVVTLRQLVLEYSIAWQVGIFATFIGFLFLGIWAWNFIKVRPFLRVYVTFLSIAIAVSSLGSLVFTILIFQIIEQNNFELMRQGAQSEAIILRDRETTALLVARTVATNDEIIGLLQESDREELRESTREFLENSEADFLRIYNNAAQVVVSPHDPRDEGRSFADDDYVQLALQQKRQVRTFSTQPGILADDLVTRGFYPVLDEDTVIGVVEVGYEFGHAFVDFSKRNTGLDITIFTGKKRAASTILTLDGVSRWEGSEITEQAVIDTVLTVGITDTREVTWLGRPYYAAFEPIRDVNGEVIGMVSVGAPVAVLFENTKQQLISTFLIVTLISLFVSLLGYAVTRNFGRK